MRRLLAANFLRLKKMHLFWGALLLHAGFGLFRLYTMYKDMQTGRYVVTIDDAFFSYILITGLTTAVFISVFLGTEYGDGAIRNKITAGHSRQSIYFANLITMTAACFLFSAAYILTVLAAGTPVFGFLTIGLKQILLTLLGTAFTSAAFCSIYTFISMSSSRKTNSAILCLLLYFGLMIATTYAAAMLDAPPEHMTIDMVDGELVSHMEPNPRYPTGQEREVYQFIIDFLPTGQANQYLLGTARLLRLELYSAAIVLVAAGGGLVYFRRKDIR